jgi:hypothetical protein
MHSRTEPEAFFLELFFNAHPTPDGKQKQKAANALVPSVIAYAGGQMDFTVDMGPEVCYPKNTLSIEISNLFCSARHD